MAEQRSPGEQAIPPMEDIELPTIKVTRENLDEALEILEKVLEERKK